MYIHALKNDVSYNIVIFLFEVCMLEVVSDEICLQIQINHVEKPPCAFLEQIGQPIAFDTVLQFLLYDMQAILSQLLH